MTEFVKLYGSILDSTVWLEAATTKVVWITMLAMADWEGIVRGAVPTLAKRASVTRNECEDALAVLSSPDPDSRTKDFDGRRIQEVDGGWLILNHKKYRDARSERQVKTAERVKRHRQKHKVALPVTDVTRSNGVKRSVRTDVDVDKDRNTESVTRNAGDFAFMSEMRPVWQNAYGGPLPPGSAKRLKPLVDQFGASDVAGRLAHYLAATDAQFASIPRFVSTYGTWDVARASKNGSHAQDEARKRGYV